MTYVRSLIGTALAAAILAGCGLTSSPADSLTFTAPKGWSGSPGIAGFMQFWKAPSSDEVLLLIKSPKPLKATEAFGSADLHDAELQSRKPITICGNQPAQLFLARGTSKNGHDATIEMVMTDAGGTTYMAMYVRPASVPQNPEAETALRQLCAK